MQHTSGYSFIILFGQPGLCFSIVKAWASQTPAQPHKSGFNESLIFNLETKHMNEQLQTSPKQDMAEELKCYSLAAEVLGTEDAVRTAANMAIQTSLMERSW